DLLMEAVGMNSASLEGEQSGDAGGLGPGFGVETTGGFAGTGSGAGGGGPGGSSFSSGSKTAPGSEITGPHGAGAPETEAFPGIRAIGANADYLAAESGVAFRDREQGMLKTRLPAAKTAIRARLGLPAPDAHLPDWASHA